MNKQYTTKRLGGNLFEVGTPALTVLISYETPVAVKYHGDGVSGTARTETRFSRSTESHLDRWVTRYDAKLAQSDLDGILHELTGDTRFSEKQSVAAKLGRTHNTRGVSGHTEAGDKHLVVPVTRRSY